MLIPSDGKILGYAMPSLSRGMNANSQHYASDNSNAAKSIKRDEC